MSLCASDFVAGVPKGLMLYGLVRKLNCSHFGSNLDAFMMKDLSFRFETDTGKQKKENKRINVFTVEVIFAMNSIPETYRLYIKLYTKDVHHMWLLCCR